MKKNLMIPIIAFFARTPSLGFSQAAKKKTAVPVKSASSAKTIAVTSTDIAEGKALVTKSDCLACHKTDSKLVGPAYKNIAVKYPTTAENYDYLANKIIKGGTGVWGRYILSIR